MSELEFDGQREGEKVEVVFRRHFLTIQKGFWLMIAIIGVGCVPMLLWQGDTRMFWIFLIFVGLGIMVYGYFFMLWYFSYYILTNERIRQVSQKGLFKRTVTDLDLDKIQSISYNIPGVGGSLFRYGTILIQTGVGDLVISKIPNTEDIYNKMQNLVGKVNK